jgi:hypothetical protein
MNPVISRETPDAFAASPFGLREGVHKTVDMVLGLL